MEKAKISGKSPVISAAVYDKLKGVDFSTDPSLISPERSPFAPNLMSGPGGYPEKRPGWRTIRSMGKPIYGMHSGRIGGETIWLVHSGDSLYRWWPYNLGRQPELLRTGINQHFSRSFVHQERIFILTGREYLVYGLFGEEGSKTLQLKNVREIATVPTTVFNSSPLGGGATLQDRNLLSNKRTVGFLGTGHNNYSDANGIYMLPDEKLTGGAVVVKVKNQETLEWETFTEVAQSASGDSSGIRLKKMTSDPNGPFWDDDREQQYSYNYPKIRGVWWGLDGGEGYYGFQGTEKDFVVDRTYGVIGFAKAPWDNTGAGSDNVEITYEVEAPEEQDRPEDLEACDTFGLFEDRVWLTGNPEKAAYDWHSGADDPTYFPETGYARVGSGGTEIMGYLQVGTAMAVVKAEGNQDASVYLRTAGTLNGQAVFPIQQGVPGQGAVSKRGFANILDDPMFLTRNGVFAISSNLVTEQRTQVNRSRFVDPRLIREPQLQNAVACSWNGMYLLSTGSGTVYLLDGKQNKVYLENSLTGSGYNYEAYHWTNVPASVWMPEGENLFFGTEDGRICRLNTDIEGVQKYNDDGKAIRAVRATRVEFCGDFLRYKTMVKKGSGLLMQPYSRSSVKAYVRTDRTKAQDFFVAALDDDDWQGDELGADFTAWEGAQVIPFKKKVKKWKWIQIIIENNVVNEGFGVYGIIVRHQKQNLV